MAERTSTSTILKMTETELTQRDVTRRMNTDGQIATIIVQTFGTVEGLVEAYETTDDLTTIEGVGPGVAESIEEWWETRAKTERQIQTRAGGSPIPMYESWESALRVSV